MARPPSHQSRWKYHHCHGSKLRGTVNLTIAISGFTHRILLDLILEEFSTNYRLGFVGGLQNLAQPLCWLAVHCKATSPHRIHRPFSHPRCCLSRNTCVGGCCRAGWLCAVVGCHRGLGSLRPPALWQRDLGLGLRWLHASRLGKTGRGFVGRWYLSNPCIGVVGCCNQFVWVFWWVLWLMSWYVECIDTQKTLCRKNSEKSTRTIDILI